jgi:S-DNA-T family DNA segregation ATPase FtsK/SpoIIIE
MFRTHLRRTVLFRIVVWMFPVRVTRSMITGVVVVMLIDDPDQAGRGAPEVDSGQSTTDEIVPVDSSDSREIWPSAFEEHGRFRPVIPAWLRSWSTLGEVVWWWLRFAWHICLFHTIRLPVYAGRLLLWSPRGLGRLVVFWAGWAYDWEAHPLRRSAVADHDPTVYLKLIKERRERVRFRLIITGLALLALLVTGLIVSHQPVVAQLAMITVVVVALGVGGVPADKPIVTRAIVPASVQKLTSDVVVRALGSLGIGEMNKALAPKGGGISFPAPIMRDGPGWRAEVDLPYGVTVTDIAKRRERLASGLRRPLACVWPESAPGEHTGRLILWVADRDMATAPPSPWPLAESGTADIFQPLPFGTDPRGRVVSILVMFANVLIGAIPRYGKTFALRVLLLAAALDPTVQLRVFELKGTGDLQAFRHVAHHYGVGADDDTIAALVDSLRDLVQNELPRRAAVIRDLPLDLCPENKIAPELAKRRSLGLFPIVLGIDEVQELFTHPTYGAEADQLCTTLIKKGPAVGLILLKATQRPDSHSLPTGISANVAIRFCLRVMGYTENDMILGTSMHHNGIRATTFTARDKGIGILVGSADDPQTVRVYYLDAIAAEAICRRARTLREKAGMLTGYAAGHTDTTSPAKPTYSLLADILAVIHPSEKKIWNDTIIDRLAELRPNTYGTWAELEPNSKTAQLTAVLKPYGITPIQIWQDGANKRGIRTADIRAAHQRHRPQQPNA